MNISHMQLDQLIGIPKGMVYNLFLDGDISPESSYENFITFCSQLSPQDEVRLHFNTGGGCVFKANTLTNAIRTSHGHFTAVLNALCGSAGTGITLACEDFEVGNGVEWFLHSIQAGTSFSEVKKIKTRTNTLIAYNERIMKDWYDLFLTEEEMEQLDNGDEITFFREELAERLEQYKTKRDELSERLMIEAMEREYGTIEDISTDDLESELKEIQQELRRRKKSKKPEQVELKQDDGTIEPVAE